MRRMLSGISILLAAAAMIATGGAAAAGQSAGPASLVDDLRAARLDLREANGVFAGAGWDRMLQDGARAQFFVVGEQHGGAEIIDLARALHGELAPLGFDYAAMEVGPYSTEQVESLIRAGPGALEDYMRAHRGVFPFLGWREEVELAEQLVRLSPSRPALWGIDQEYVGAGPILLDLLTRRQRTPAQRDAVARLSAAVGENRMLVRDLRQADVTPLMEAFRDDPEALEIIEDYRLSGEIYEPFTVPGSNRYRANLTRETYMKRNFAAAFAEAERRDGRAPKVFMKMGANHAMRGFSASTVPALGNFLVEWGVPRGHEMINVMIDCVSDQAEAPCRPYFGAEHAIYAAASSDKYTVIDLRPVRARLRAFPDIDATSRDLVQAFDFYVLIRDVRRAAPAVTAPATSEPTPRGAATQP